MTNTDTVLFLDLDDVAVLKRVMLAMPGSDGGDPITFALIAKICAATGARIVVTSNWRSSHIACRDLFDHHGLTPYLWSPIIIPSHPSYKPDTDDWRVQAQNNSRSNAIDAWLDAHPYVINWIIIDDLVHDFDPTKLARLVQADPDYGLGTAHYNRAIRLLAGDRDDDIITTPATKSTICDLANQALIAIDQGDDDAVALLLTTIKNHPLAK